MGTRSSQSGPFRSPPAHHGPCPLPKKLYVCCSFLFLEHARGFPASRPSHLMFPLLGMPFPSQLRWMTGFFLICKSSSKCHLLKETCISNLLNPPPHYSMPQLVLAAWKAPVMNLIAWLSWKGPVCLCSAVGRAWGIALGTKESWSKYLLNKVGYWVGCCECWNWG